jgi:hypothetical protein
MKGKIISIGWILTALLLTRCANVVAPTGGAKDTTPPEVVEAKPANHSTGFDGNKIELTFDEYVTLNNASQQVLVSPPLAVKPDIKLSGKTVSIKFKEALKPNTTYTINFGEAVKDLHEGNQFKDYHFSFSTGDHLDTLNLVGKVLNADDKKPAADFFVSLYAAADSLFDQPTRRAPDFITKTDKEGAFGFHGLPDRHFLVFALQDMNSNLYYDLPNEKVAFLDTLVSPADSVSLTLYAFTEIDTTQMLLESKLVEEGLLRFVFRHPAENVRITTNDVLPNAFRKVEVWSKQHDTLCWYFTPEVMDSLWVEIHSEVDTLINSKIHFNLQYKGSKSRNERDAHLLKVSNNLKNNLLCSGEDLLLRFSEPVVDLRFHDTSILIIGADTVFNAMRFEQVDDYGLSYCLDTTIFESEDYILNITDSVFFSVRNRTHKAFSLKFKRANDNDFGAVILKVGIPEHRQVVIQLLNNKGAVVDQQVVDTATTVAFRQLLPGKYKLQAIIDTDKNALWSTGNFHRRALPETIFPYKDEFDVKPGWDIVPDEIWELR